MCAACLLFRHFFLFCLSFCIACTLLRFRFYNFLQFDFFISLGSISISFPPSPSHIPFDLLSISFNLIVQLPISLPPSLSLGCVVGWLHFIYHDFGAIPVRLVALWRLKRCYDFFTCHCKSLPLHLRHATLNGSALPAPHSLPLSLCLFVSLYLSVPLFLPHLPSLSFCLPDA